MRSTRSTIWRALLIATAVALTTMPIARVGALGSPTSSRAPKAAHPRALVARSDFNGDGYSDVAIGVPQESVGAVSTAGAVNVLYGSAQGLSAVGNQLWSQDTPGIEDTAEEGDTFGRSVAAGDVNGDGFADLVVGAPHEAIGTVECGAFSVIYGSSAGLTSTGNQFWSQDSPDILNQCDYGDEYARYVAVGDFNFDGYDDVAASIGGEDVNGVLDAGAVSVLYGSAAGLTAVGNQLWTEDDLSSSDGSEKDDNMGDEWVRAADFNGDGYADLAISDRHEDLEGSPTIPNAGAAIVVYGSAAGLSAAGNQFWTENDLSSSDGAETEDEFGRHLAVADFNGDGYKDLAVGIRDEDVGTVVDAGAAAVIYGSAAGLTAAGNQFWTEDKLSSSDGSETGDLFSRSMTGGDFNGDGYDDLAIGIRDEDLEQPTLVQNCGAASVIYGGPNGLDANAGPGNQFWTQDSQGIKDVAEANDKVPIGINNADYNADGFMDLVLATRHEDVGTVYEAGAANVLYGSAAGLTALHNQFWSQASPGIKEVPETEDQFGSSVS